MTVVAIISYRLGLFGWNVQFHFRFLNIRDITQVTWLVVTEVQRESFAPVTERRHYNACPIYVLGFYVVQLLFFIVECVITCFLCAVFVMRIFNVWHHPHPLSHPCAKFHFCRALHCWDDPRRKMVYSSNQSINHSVTHSFSLFDAPGTEAFASEQAQRLASPQDYWNYASCDTILQDIQIFNVYSKTHR